MVKTRRGKRRSSVDINIPKQKINRQSRKKLKEMSDLPKASTKQPISSIEQLQPFLQQSEQLNENIFYLIIFLVLTAIICAYFVFFQ